MIALLPIFSGTLDKLGVHSTALATTWLRSAFDPRVPLDPRLADMIQRSVDHEYQSTSSPRSRRRARPRRTRSTRSPRAGSGPGAQALERGLIDPVGLYGDALGSAAERAKLGDDPRILYIEREPGAFSRFVSLLDAEVAATFSALDRRRLAASGRPARGAGPRHSRELGWLAGLLERRKPFDAVAHCLCTRAVLKAGGRRLAATLNPAQSRRCATCAAPAWCSPAPARARRA